MGAARRWGEGALGGAAAPPGHARTQRTNENNDFVF